MKIKDIDLSTATSGVDPSWGTVAKATDIKGTELDLTLTAVAAPQDETVAGNSSEDAFTVTYTIAMPTV